MLQFDTVTTRLAEYDQPRYRPPFGVGYDCGHIGSQAALRVYNTVLAAVLIVCAVPFMIVIAVLIKLRDRGPVFYKGTRLGQHKRLYYMYKFRTLPVGAQKAIGARLLQPSDPMVTRFARGLRDTRLDELPQLFNILRGDMDFIGPRPIRPEIYETQCRDIPSFDRRFCLRPGLIGYSQLFMPHSTPKRMQAMMENRLLRRPRNLRGDLRMILYTIALVLREIVVQLRRQAHRTIDTRVLRRYTERRSLERVRQRGARMRLRDAPERVLPLADINEHYFRVRTGERLPGGEWALTLEVDKRSRGRVKRKHAHCRGRVFKILPADGGGREAAVIVRYRPDSALNRFVVDQYFLKKSLK